MMMHDHHDHAKEEGTTTTTTAAEKKSSRSVLSGVCVSLIAGLDEEKGKRTILVHHHAGPV
jgi:hypothetical protein